MDFQIDNLTVILLLVLVVLAIYYRFFSEASPLVHPLLLGKQSEVSAVRKPGETGVSRSFATGQGTPVCLLQAWRDILLIPYKLTVRPANGLKTVSDIVPNSNGSSLALPRSILDVSVSSLF